MSDHDQEATAEREQVNAEATAEREQANAADGEDPPQLAETKVEEDEELQSETPRHKNNTPPPQEPGQEEEGLAEVDDENIPTAVEYRTLEDRLLALEDDNAALRRMICRNTAEENYSEMTPIRKLQDEIMKEKHVIRAEQHKRRAAEARVNEQRESYENVIHKKDTDIRSLQTQLLTARNELSALHHKTQETDRILGILKNENARLLELVPPGHRQETTPSYFASPKVKPDRIKRDVPSAKLFSQVLRSVSPLFKERSHSPTRALLSPRGTNGNPRITSSVVSVDGSRQAALMRSPSPVGKMGRYSTAKAQRESRGTTPRGGSATATAPPVTAHPLYEIGAQVTWLEMQCFVRYIGHVYSIGEGEWFGLEVPHGRGEHHGTLNSVRYFTTVGKSAVFCRATELSAPREAIPTPRTARSRTSSPQVTVRIRQ